MSVSNATTSGNWKIERQIDRITGTPLPSAQLMTAASSNSAVTTTRPAGLQFTCFERQPLVRISFDFKIGADMSGSRTLYVRIRSLNAHTTAEFSLEGTASAVQAAFADCPLSGKPAKRKMS